MKQIGTIFTMYGSNKNRIVCVSVPVGWKTPSNVMVLSEDTPEKADFFFESLADLSVGTGTAADKFYKETGMSRGDLGFGIIARYTNKLTNHGFAMKDFAGGVANQFGFYIDNTDHEIVAKLDNWLIEAVMKADDQAGTLLLGYQEAGHEWVKAQTIFQKEDPKTHGTASITPHMPIEGDELVKPEIFAEFIMVNLTRSMFFQMSK